MNRFLKYSMILALLILAGTVQNSAATDSPKPKKQPATVQESRQAEPPAPVAEVADATYNFGELIEDAEINHDFVLKNTGKGELIIDKVQTS